MATSDQKINRIATLSSVLFSTLDEGVFFAKLSSSIKEMFIGDSVSVFVSRGEESSQLVALDGQIVENAPICGKGQSLAGQVIKMKRAYYSNAVRRDPLFSSLNIAEGVNAELSVPISVEGVILGAINLSSGLEDRSFSEKDITSVLELLNAVEIPMRNMKMYLMARNLNRELMKKIEERKKDADVSVAAPVKVSSEDMGLMGHSLIFHEMINKISKIAKSDVNVIICGASGTGKELLSRKIHAESARRRGACIMVNCSAIKESILEAELFGVESGVYGENVAKEGLIEKAHGGILIFDEISHLGTHIQAKLLRFIETGTAYRVGSHRPYVSSARIISLTSKDIGHEVEEGRFREDLLYRLNSVTLMVPSLSERRDDIKLLAEHFLNSGINQGEEKSLTYAALEVLSNYNWPGNIRELKTVMERVRVLSDGVYIDVNDLPEFVKVVPEVEEQIEDSYQEITLDELERKHICATLKHLDGNKTRTAKALGITVKTLYNKLHSYGMVGSVRD